MLENFQGKEERITSCDVYLYIKQPSKVTGMLLKLSLLKIVVLFALGETKKRETALHIAVAAKRTAFVMELVNHMNKEDLALINKDDNTALCFAAASGIKEIAEVMVRKNEELPLMRGKMNVTPLNMAAMFGHRNMVSYLYGVTPFENYLLMNKLASFLVLSQLIYMVRCPITRFLYGIK
jgi:hypothetical protein